MPVSRILKRLGVGIAHRPQATIRHLVMRPKDPLPRGETANVIYRVKCDSCAVDYFGETGKWLQTRMAEHCRAVRTMDPLSLVAEHCANSGHTFAFQNAEILARGNDRVVREAIEAWDTGTTSINHCVALPTAYQAVQTQLSEEKSKREHRRNANPHTCEPMVDTRVAELQADIAIISSASSSGQPASVKPDGSKNASRIPVLGRRLRPMTAAQARTLEADRRPLD
ncbi:unnamed protein product [Dibothriocephalus latus]|uniref:GIY-YIG domain-containing protein n=1 Tax=Dibothriocephalus latus TaxID=60516 RepID=A0A3P7R7K5_DIBLA|nr:unnamed protein product [Dibothriocephalus latus]